MPELTMPKMGDAMEEGTIVRWLKKEGDPVVDEEPIAEIATDKANVEVPAYQSGTLGRILVREGETVAVGTPIAVLDTAAGGREPGAADVGAGDVREAPSAQSPAPANAGREAAQSTAEPPGREPPVSAKESPAQPASELPAAETGAARPPVREPPPSERVKASPLARRIAAERGFDLAQILGTGPSGRILEADVIEFQRRPAIPPRDAGPPPQERGLSPMRKAIARRLTESKQTIPHFYLAADCDAAPIVALRAAYNSTREEDRRVSLNDLIVKAVALAVQRVPALNTQLAGDRLRALAGVHVGVAIALDEGLIVPVVRDCEAKPVSQIGREIRSLGDRARAGRLQPDEYSGGSITVTNLGMYGVEYFAAVINPPEAAIVAVGAVRDAPVVEDGAVVPGKRMRVTLSVDHRIVDGAVAANFLNALKTLVETPLGLLE